MPTGSIHLASAEEMLKLDQETCAQKGIRAELLMENAGQQAAQYLAREFAPGTRFLFFCGGGNNGGDGFVAARHLARMGFRPRVIFAGDPDKASPLCRRNHDWLIDYLPGSVTAWDGNLPQDTDVIVDALLGVGARGETREPIASCIRAINQARKDCDIHVASLAGVRHPCRSSGRNLLLQARTSASGVALHAARQARKDCGSHIVSLDIPSGLYAGAESVSGDCIVRADTTLTFGHPKIGMQISPMREYCGRIILFDIFFPAELSESILSPRWWVTGSSLRQILPSRPSAAHKGTMGRLLIIAGSAMYPGAAILAARGALASGTGLVHLAIPASAAGILPNRPADVIVHAIPDAGLGYFGNSSVPALSELLPGMSALVLGPGLGRQQESLDCARRIIANWDRPLLLDADALPVMHDPCALPSQTVCTPHYGEFMRLVQSGRASASDADPCACMREDQARDLAARTHAIIVVKDASNLVACPDGRCYWLTSGHPCLARGGMGDVLAGYLGGLLARGMDPRNAALLAVWLHGAGAHRAQIKHGSDGVTAEILAATLAPGLARLQKGEMNIPSEPAWFTGVQRREYGANS
ncbi:MAG: NAD(P)H-hydrate dehydratase [Spirochaetota bacterium]|jgi:NAD(P)H-hydrate epimerase|nr:NAD(P)H-hydrate dehydratase [Spirochaetota bacterium]